MSNRVAPDVAWVVNDATGIVAGQRLQDGSVVGLSDIGSGVNTSLDAAGIAAAAAAGTLTPLTLYAASDSGALYYAYSSSIVSAITTSAHLGTITTAAMLAVSAPSTGMTCDLSDLGNIVSRWRYNGTYWAPLGGRQQIFSLLADTYDTTATDATETINTGCQVMIPAGILAADGMGWRLAFSGHKSAGVETAEVRIRWGSTGTTADALIHGQWTLATTTRGCGQTLSGKRASATTMQPQGVGNITATNHRWGNAQASGARLSAATTDFGVANYLSMTVVRGTPFNEYVLCDVFDVWLTGR